MNVELTRAVTPPSSTDASDGDEPGSSANIDADEPPEPPPPEPPASCDDGPSQGRLQLTSAAPIDQLGVRWLDASLNRALSLLPQPIDSVSVVIIDDTAMSDLHARHLGAASTTDVMTFDLRDSSNPQGPIDCEIYICLDEAKRRSVERGWPPARELLLYAVHGILHCCGFDDQDPADSAHMHAEEDRILAAIGVGPTYDDKDRGDLENVS